MYDKDKVEDSLEFIKKIYLYEKCSPDKVSDMMSMQNVRRKDFSDLENYQFEKKTQNIHTEHFELKDDALEKEEDAWKFSVLDFVYIIACMAISILIAYGITNFVAHHTKVEGSSMNDTLYDGDYLLVEKISYYFDEPKRYDIVIFPYSEDVNYIKRVIGLPGEKIQIIDGKIYINDEMLKDDIHGKDVISDPGILAEPLYVNEGEVIVMGDNRNSSIDSRKESVGTIDIDKIEGRACFRLWPFSSFGKID